MADEPGRTGGRAGDPDRQAVYGAETAAAPEGGRRFVRFTDLERFVGAVLADPWWEQTFPDAPVSVELHRRSRSATFSAAHVTDDGWDGVIWIRDGSWDMVTVLHELAHIAAGSWRNPDRWSAEAGHGPRFVDGLVQLWRRHMGLHAYGALRLALTERGVTLDHHGPRSTSSV